MNCDVRQPIQDAFTPATNVGKLYKLTLKPERGKTSTNYVNLFNGLHIFICMMNLGEIVYLTKRRFGDEKKIEVVSRIYQLGLTVLSVTDSLVFQAAELKAKYALSYAGCFALACAVNHSATLVTGDPEFKTVAHLIEIAWIR